MTARQLTADDAAGATRAQAAEDLDTPDLYSGGDSVGVGSDGSGAVGSVSVAVFLLKQGMEEHACQLHNVRQSHNLNYCSTQVFS